MDGFITTKEASIKWDISMRRINILCQTERIPGAYKEDNQWFIPADAKKPIDKRLKTENVLLSAYAKAERKLPLPIGISDYKKASCEYYYVDKTLLIRDVIDERPQVSIFTRPHRFGKTLNMDMLRVFFERTDLDTSVYFKNKKIWTCGEEYQKHQGKYPIIYVTFKDMTCKSWDVAYDLVFKILRIEFERHSELLKSDKISSYDKEYITNIIKGNVNENDVALAFYNLSRMLHTHYGTAPIIMIDEYDAPIQQGYLYGYSDNIILFLQNLFSGGLKDNPHVSHAFMTGILGMEKETIFNSLNNLKINSILDHRYSEYFGFTSDEVREMAQYYDVPEKYEEICEWYDSYLFGKTKILNPWSVIGYFNNECIPKAFWQSARSNDILRKILAHATNETFEKLESLLQGKSIVTHINTSVIEPQFQNNPSTIYSFLLLTGYLKAVTKEQTFSGDYICEVALPNREISYIYSKEILSHFENMIPISTVISLQEAIYTMDILALQKSLGNFLLQTISFQETFYHGLILGLYAVMNHQYHITYHQDAVTGRFHLQMLPLNKNLPDILIELKAGKDSKDDSLNQLAKTALKQINDRKYQAEMKDCGAKEILKYGIAFCGKKVWIVTEINK